MKGPISRPVNPVQRRFNEACEEGGGPGGGPTRGKVLDLLQSAGTQLNEEAFAVAEEHLSQLPERNPWHVCYAISLSWGHLAKLDVDFTDAASALMSNWNDEDLSTARTFHLERGPEVIEASLSAGHVMFEKVRLPDALPDTLGKMQTAQNRWLGRVLSPDRPRYMGAWNATAVFMVALFAQPGLADQLVEPTVQLPPSGAVFNALNYLHTARYLTTAPDGSDLDDEAFEPGVLATNNALFADIRRGRDDWSLLDVHSGLYVLGTKEPGAGTQISVS